MFFLVPDGNGDVTFALVAEAACAAGGICTPGGRALTEAPAAATIPGPGDPEEEPAEAPAKPRGLSATATHDLVTLTWDEPGDDSITGYVILRRIPGVDPQGHFDELAADTGTATATYTDNTVAAETRYTYRIKAINGAGASERSRWFHINTEAAPEPETPPESANAPATGAPTISGTAQVGRTLTADGSGIADEDGLSNVQYEYQWLADGAAIAGANGSTYTLTGSEEGKAVRVTVSFTDDAGNGESLTSAATAAVAAKPVPLTASFPVSPFQSSRHLGDDDRPQVIVAFNQPVQSFTRTTPSVSVHGATAVSAARHQEDGLENAWIFWLDPEGDEDLVFTLVAGRSCDGGGICTPGTEGCCPRACRRPCPGRSRMRRPEDEETVRRPTAQQPGHGSAHHQRHGPGGRDADGGYVGHRRRGRVDRRCLQLPVAGGRRPNLRRYRLHLHPYR